MDFQCYVKPLGKKSQQKILDLVGCEMLENPS